MTRSETVRPRRPSHPWAWLPEPVLTGDGALGRLDTPQACAAVGMPRLIRLERLAPVERAAFVLHEVFGHRSAETAEVLDLPEGRCRALRQRARRQLRAGEGEAESGAGAAPGERRRLAADLVRAVLDADQPALEELLADDVVAWSDGGAQPGTVRRPIVGVPKVARFLAGLRQQSPPGLDACVAQVNGGPAAVAAVGGTLIGVLVPEFGPQGLTGLRLVSDADRLEYARRQWARRR
jgi:RNA polymerase sigma-70 factor (ECF subfamily)